MSDEDMTVICYRCKRKFVATLRYLAHVHMTALCHACYRVIRMKGKV